MGFGDMSLDHIASAGSWVLVPSASFLVTCLLPTKRPQAPNRKPIPETLRHNSNAPRTKPCALDQAPRPRRGRGRKTARRVIAKICQSNAIAPSKPPCKRTVSFCMTLFSASVLVWGRVVGSGGVIPHRNMGVIAFVTQLPFKPQKEVDPFEESVADAGAPATRSFSRQAVKVSVRGFRV